MEMRSASASVNGGLKGGMCQCKGWRKHKRVDPAAVEEERNWRESTAELGNRKIGEELDWTVGARRSSEKLPRGAEG